MRQILHIVIHKDPMVEQVLKAQKAIPDADLKVVELDQPDYSLLVEQIFKADSVAVWS